MKIRSLVIFGCLGVFAGCGADAQQGTDTVGSEAEVVDDGKSDHASGSRCIGIGADMAFGFFNELAAALDPSVVNGNTINIPGAITSESADGTFFNGDQLGLRGRASFTTDELVVKDDSTNHGMVISLLGQREDGRISLEYRAAKKIYDKLTRANEIMHSGATIGSPGADWTERKSARGNARCIHQLFNGGDLYECYFVGMSSGSITDVCR